MFKRLIRFIVILGLVFGTFFAFQVITFDPSNTQYTLGPELLEQVRSQTPNYVALKELPEHFYTALVAVEDKRFYRHYGFDLISITKALQRNLVEKSYAAGGSTITQQLAKNLFYTQEKRLSRKIYELWTAIQLERLFSKDEILEMYINIIYYGQDAYGVAQAARVYFDKPASQLTLEESALLVGILPAPSVYNPIVNPDLAKERQNNVLWVYDQLDGPLKPKE